MSPGSSDRPSSGQASSSGHPIPPSSISNTEQHRPTIPSGLRQTHMPPRSPELQRRSVTNVEGEQRVEEEGPGVQEDGIHPHTHHDAASVGSNDSRTGIQGVIEEPHPAPDARSRLLELGKNYQVPDCGDPNCRHGALSPKPKYQRNYGSFASPGFGGHSREGSIDSGPQYRGDFVDGALGEAVTDGLLGDRNNTSTTRWLADRHGIEGRRMMYLVYYFPFINWIRQYRWSYLRGDFIAALTMASFYIPISLSYASNLGHIPPINGLYSFVFNPLIYAFLGTCPQMVVGPEAAGSLLTGGVVKEAIEAGHHPDKQGQKNAQVAGMVTGLAGAVILASGLCRLGFLDSVLSRPFLRGFISAIGIVIMVDQLIPEMGLDTAAAHSSSASHGSSLDKMLFLFRHGHEAHKLTCIVSFSTIAIVLILRELKKRLQDRMNWVAYVPDRFIVVVLSAVFAWWYDWESQGLAILGDIKAKGTPFKPEFPFAKQNFKHVTDAFATGFVVALLGFFESSVAAKSLGINGGGKKKKVHQPQKYDGNDEEDVEEDGIKGMTVSPNRELVALGVANIVGGVFMALPAFGGYGRSKVNASTGGKTPMSSIFLSLISVICVLFLLPYFYYIPKGVLSAMISVVAYSLIEEAPHDIFFFYKISGWNELMLMTLIFLTTFFWNLRIGIAVGIGLSLLRLLKHSTRPRIQILGRVQGTSEFESVEFVGERNIEFVPHCLIVKIPEPLTFANTGTLNDRLRRLEDHGTGNAHPALPRVRHSQHNQNIIFDVHGVTSLDPAACQVLLEIVQSYIERGTRVFFCRVPSRRSEVWRLMQVSGIVELCGGERHFLRSVEEALMATERAVTLIADEEEEAMVGERSRTEGGGVGDEVAGIRERMTARQDPFIDGSNSAGNS